MLVRYFLLFGVWSLCLLVSCEKSESSPKEETKDEEEEQSTDKLDVDDEDDDEPQEIEDPGQQGAGNPPVGGGAEGPTGTMSLNIAVANSGEASQGAGLRSYGGVTRNAQSDNVNKMYDAGRFEGTSILSGAPDGFRFHLTSIRLKSENDRVTLYEAPDGSEGALLSVDGPVLNMADLIQAIGASSGGDTNQVEIDVPAGTYESIEIGFREKAEIKGCLTGSFRNYDHQDKPENYNAISTTAELVNMFDWVDHIDDLKPWTIYSDKKADLRITNRRVESPDGWTNVTKKFVSSTQSGDDFSITLEDSIGSGTADLASLAAEMASDSVLVMTNAGDNFFAVIAAVDDTNNTVTVHVDPTDPVRFNANDDVIIIKSTNRYILTVEEGVGSGTANLQPLIDLLNAKEPIALMDDGRQSTIVEIDDATDEIVIIDNPYPNDFQTGDDIEAIAYHKHTYCTRGGYGHYDVDWENFDDGVDMATNVAAQRITHNYHFETTANSRFTAHELTQTHPDYGEASPEGEWMPFKLGHIFEGGEGLRFMNENPDEDGEGTIESEIPGGFVVTANQTSDLTILFDINRLLRYENNADFQSSNRNESNFEHGQTGPFQLNNGVEESQRYAPTLFFDSTFQDNVFAFVGKPGEIYGIEMATTTCPLKYVDFSASVDNLSNNTNNGGDNSERSTGIVCNVSDTLPEGADIDGRFLVAVWATIVTDPANNWVLFNLMPYDDNTLTVIKGGLVNKDIIGKKRVEQDGDHVLVAAEDADDEAVIETDKDGQPIDSSSFTEFFKENTNSRDILYGLGDLMGILYNFPKDLCDYDVGDLMVTPDGPAHFVTSVVRKVDGHDGPLSQTTDAFAVETRDAGIVELTLKMKSDNGICNPVE